VAVGIAANVTDEAAVQAAVDATVPAFGGLDLVVNSAGLSLSKSLLDTTVADWDLQHNVMAKGSFLVSRAAAKVLIEQQLGGDIVYISSKNSLFAGPNNIAYSATKADQAHQVRLSPPSSASTGSKSTASTPTVWSGDPASSPAAGVPNGPPCTGVAEEELGGYYAQRTLLKREALPEHCANAVFVLCSDDLSHTTGLHIPVDAGVAAAFLR
jgi:NAD(P)-dependent dehydrogenase (short-subunit alcohol dehydrogenase family)